MIHMLNILKNVHASKYGKTSLMFSHITVGSNDLDTAEAFYDAVLEPIGLKQREVIPDGGPEARCWVKDEAKFPRFFVYSPFDKSEANAGNGSMVAFLAGSPSSVDRAYEAGLDKGGTCEGKPGPRDHYAKGYYGAYLRDPDGNKIHIVFRDDF